MWGFYLGEFFSGGLLFKPIYGLKGFRFLFFNKIFWFEDPTKFATGEEQSYLDKICYGWRAIIFEAPFHKKFLKPKYVVLFDIVSKNLMSTSESLEQVSTPKIKLMTTIKESQHRDFNWMRFLINTVVAQEKEISITDGVVDLKGKVLHASKIAYILESLKDNKDAWHDCQIFSITKLMFKPLTKKTLREDKKKRMKALQLPRLRRYRKLVLRGNVILPLKKYMPKG